MLFLKQSVTGQLSDYPGLGAYSNKFADILSSQLNIASLSALHQTSAGVFAEKKFLFKELANYQLAVGFPVSSGGASISAAYSGDINFNISQLQIAYAKNLGRIQLGLAAGVHRLSMNGYGATNSVKAQLATIWHVTTKVYAGVQLTNPHLMFAVRSSLNSIPVYRFGLGYESSENLFVAMEIYKESGAAVSVHVVVKYYLSGKFFLSFGVMGAAACPFFTAGLKWGQVRFEMSFGYHAQLGISPATAFIFEASEKVRK